MSAGLASGAIAVTPAMAPRPAAPLSTWSLLRTASTNVLAICDEELFEELVVARRYVLQKTLFVSDPVGIKHVLVDRSDNYGRMTTIRRLFEIELGTGTLASEGPTWRRHQRVATPSIDPRAIRPDVPALIGLAEEVAETMPAGPVVDLDECIVAMSTPLWNHVVTGGDPAGLPILAWLKTVPRRPRFSDFVPKPEWVSRLLVRPPRDARIAALDADLRAMIDARLRDDWAGSRDLIWRLAHARDRDTGEGLPLVEVRDETANLISGGSTGIRGLTWLWYLLAHHPAVEDRLHAELDRVLDGHPLRPDRMPELTYARQVLDEAMRLYPPIPAMVRQAKAADVVCGHRVPRGGLVVVMPYIVHRHRKLWPDPDRFDPDRFSPERSAGRPRFAHIPFAAGPRVCPGQSFAMTHMLIVLSAFARRFRVRFATDEPVRPVGGVSLRPRGGLAVRLERR